MNNSSGVAWIGAEMEFALSQAVASGDAFEHRPPECGHCVQNFLADLDLRDLPGEAARFELGADQRCCMNSHVARQHEDEVPHGLFDIIPLRLASRSFFWQASRFLCLYAFCRSPGF